MKQEKQNKSFRLSEVLWDLWCIVSVVGIWPRYIEPKCLAMTHLNLNIPGLPERLDGLKVLQLSDLHLHPHTPDFFLKKIISKVKKLAPDLIVFTGDFICYSTLFDHERLQQFLCELHAPSGCYAVLGNHDYQKYVSISNAGDYDVIEAHSSSVRKGLKRLWEVPRLTKKVTSRALGVSLNQNLVSLLKQTPFQLLHNRTMKVPVRGSYLNICGLGEYMLGRFQPEVAFQTYDRDYPGIILAHNPDSVALLKGYPGELVLCGHTHGGQVNLPGLSKKFTLLENMNLKKGLWKIDDKWVYINRGLGSVMNFRWFSCPELSLFTLRGVS